MDIVSSGASVVAFITLTAKTVIALTDIVGRFRGAPQELLHLSRQFELLHSELTFINNLRESSSDDNLDLLPDEVIGLRHALNVADLVIKDVQKACEKYKQEGKVKTYNKLVWVFHDQSKMRETVSRLQQAEMSLHSILLCMNLRIANLSRKAIATTSPLAITSTVTLVPNAKAIRKYVSEAAQQGKPPENVVLNSLATRDPHDRNKFWGSKTFLEESWLRFLGFQAVMSRYGNDYQTTYDISGRLQLHQLLGVRLICLDLRLRRFPLAGFGLSFVSGGIRLKNVVPEDSQIMTACKLGDVVLVKELFRKGLASPNDVTPENSSPLRYAIENGSTELVRVIVDSGTDVNAPFGKFMTSPLEWAFASRKMAIARLFLERGAKIDHISAKGWTPAFNLFGYRWIHGSDEPCTEYLDLLSAASFSEFDIQDVDGWSAMHRAAAFGSCEDIAALVSHGAPCALLTTMEWAPIRCAVKFENENTFVELAKHLPPSFVDEKDIRGWTILHEAASMGSRTMLRLVLRYGADPHITSYKTSYLVPQGLENRAVTAADVAKNKGKEAYENYINALKETGYDVTYGKIKEEIEEMEEIFWPAELIL